jgi:hypothetical protein
MSSKRFEVRREGLKGDPGPGVDVVDLASPISYQDFRSGALGRNSAFEANLGTKGGRWIGLVLEVLSNTPVPSSEPLCVSK